MGKDKGSVNLQYDHPEDKDNLDHAKRFGGEPGCVSGKGDYQTGCVISLGFVQTICTESRRRTEWEVPRPP